MILFFTFCKEISALYSIGFQNNNAITKDLNEIYQFKDNVMTLLYPCASTNSCTGYKLVLPKGKCKFEVWGANGGDAGNNTGGNGGYSVGEIEFASSTVIYANIGGKGSYTNEYKPLPQYGGFIGGRNARSLNITYYGAGAGGSTDIRILRNSVHNRVIVAGGGGGAGSLEEFTGGFGGGESGGNGNYSHALANLRKYYCVISGGSQTVAGISQNTSESDVLYKDGFFKEADFFYGGSLITTDNTGWSSGGGGGGWYGGARECVGGASGAGGSGFIFTNQSENGECYLSSAFHLQNAQMKSGDDSAIEKQLNNDGNGLIKITFIEYSLGTFFPKITCRMSLQQSLKYCIFLGAFVASK